MAQARWLCDALDRCRPDAGGAVQLMDLKKWWEASLTGNHAAPFDTLKEGEAWQVLLKHGLVLTPERSREAAPVYNEAELVRDVG